MADFTSYEQALKWVKKGKDPAKGRKARSLMLRLVDGDVIVVSHAWRRWMGARDKREWVLADFAEWRSDNVFTFTRTSSDMRPMSASISNILWRLFGLNWLRVGVGRYEVFYYDFMRGGPTINKVLRDDLAVRHEHFQGMAWDMTHHKCVNPRKPLLESVDRKKRKAWLTDLRKFNRAFNTRLKLGIIDTVIRECESDSGDMPTPGRDDIADAVLASIKSGEVHTDLLEMLVRYSRIHAWRNTIDARRVRATLTNLLSTNSVKFRQAYGVLPS